MARTKITKRKGIAGFFPPTRNKAAKTADEVECGQLRCEVHALEVQRAGLWKTQRELEEQKREVEEQLREVLREVEHVQQNLATDRKRIEELENNQRLGKLPQELWKKILDNLSGSDLFPLALSCRYFRQKQKELVARWDLCSLEFSLEYRVPGHNHYDVDPVSADYLRFCLKEKVSREDEGHRARDIRYLAAYHGYLPLLQELVTTSEMFDSQITWFAGESSSS